MSSDGKKKYTEEAVEINVMRLINNFTEIYSKYISF